MEKLNIPLENEQLRPKLDWIIDHASETNFAYPPVSFLNPVSFYINFFRILFEYYFVCLNRSFGNIRKSYGETKAFSSVSSDQMNTN